ncbi:MAG: UbiH/UbiF family hydroxylase [Rhizobiaceae bacterium]|nr:UbiH/UbiF family hydroxylase [Rhizobiaceae bacterium]
MSQDIETDIVVAGTGPAGLLAAHALSRAGFGVALVGPEPKMDDKRTTALMLPALDLLDRLGVLGEISAAAAPLKTMRIVDGTSRLVRSAPVTFRAREIGKESFGLNIPNTALLGAATRALTRRAGIAWLKTTVARWRPEDDAVHADLPDGTTVSALLAVAADGRTSPAREAAGISTRTRNTQQAALVLNFGHARDHGFISTEFHTETGPFTQVPLPGMRSSLVWVERPAAVEELSQLDDAALSQRVEDRMQSMLGRVTVEPGRQIYPLSTLTPDRFAWQRIALVGEAAHVFPPIGAQGLNLGIRDIADVVAVAERFRDDPGAPGALAAYDQKRRPDVTARSFAVDLLNRSLLSDFLPVQMTRSAGLAVLGEAAPVRGFFMREGMQPGSGVARMFTALREKVRRQ